MTRCSNCGRAFGGVTAFDAHRVGRYEQGHYNPRKKRYVVDAVATRRCMSDKELLHSHLTLVDGKWRIASPMALVA